MDPQKQSNQSTPNKPHLAVSSYNKVLFALLIFALIALPSFVIFLHRFYPEKLPSLPADNSTIPPFTPPPIITLTPSPNSSPSATIDLSPAPPAKTIPLRTHVFQTFNNCGPASLSMAMSYFGINETQQVLGQSLRPYQNPQGDNDDKSVSLAEISLKAREYGLVSYHRPAGNLEMLKLFIANDIPVITRTWLSLEEDISHYRLVRGYDETTQQIIQDDSYQNKNLKFSYSEFFNLWQSFNYEFIVIASPNKQALIEQILRQYSLLDEQSAWQVSYQISQQELQKDPDNFYAKFNSSIALYHLGRYQESVAAFESSQSFLPRRMLWYQLEPFLAYYHLGDYEQVLSMTDHILNDGNRGYSELHHLRGLIFQSKGEMDKANESFALADQYNSSSYWKENL